MDEEEELENTLIGQEEEAPAIDTGDVMMGGLPVLAGSTLLTNTTGGPPATTGGTLTTTTPGGQTGGGQPRLTGPTRPSADDFDFRLNRATPSRLARFGGLGSLIYGAADLGTQALTGTGLSERIGEFGGGAVGNLLFPGAQNQPAFTEAELQRSRDNLSTGAQLDIMREDAEASVAPVTEVTPLQAALGALDKEIAGRESNIVNNQVELAKQINELGTVSDDQRAVQNFMDERAERSGTTATDVITPFQEQAELTADLFTDPNTAIGQFVPRATFTLPDGTIIQEDEGGNRREISAEQLRQFEQDMASVGSPSVVGLGRGGDAGVIKSFDRPMGSEETQAAIGGMTLNEYLNAPSGTPGASGLRTDPQGRMISSPAPVAVNNFAPQVAGGGNAVGLPILESNPVPMPGTRPGDRNPSQGDPGFSPRPPSLRDPDEGFIRPAPNLSDFERDSLARQIAIGGTGSFAGDSAAREARIAARPDFGEAVSDRERRAARGEGLSQSDLRDLAQGSARGATEGERARALEIQQRAGLGEFKPEQTELQKDFTQKRIALMDEQLAQSGIVPSAPPVVDPETGVITQEYSDGTTRFKGVARSPSVGGINFDGFVSDDEGSQSSDTVKMTDRDGKLREVPKGDVQEAIKNGYTPVGEEFTPNI